MNRDYAQVRGDSLCLILQRPFFLRYSHGASIVLNCGEVRREVRRRCLKRLFDFFLPSLLAQKVRAGVAVDLRGIFARHGWEDEWATEDRALRATFDGVAASEVRAVCSPRALSAEGPRQVAPGDRRRRVLDECWAPVRVLVGRFNDFPSQGA